MLAVTAFADDVVLPDGKAKTLIENTCSECHGLDRIAETTMSSGKWRATVSSMVRKGATLSPEEIDTVVEYLSVYFAPDKINVNTATAQELQNALDLSAGEAGAVVRYRTANGKFKDFADLQKVPGVDAKKFADGKDQIAF
jgi:competence protein ComEA